MLQMFFFYIILFLFFFFCIYLCVVGFLRFTVLRITIYGITNSTVLRTGLYGLYEGPRVWGSTLIIQIIRYKSTNSIQIKIEAINYNTQQWK